MTECDIIFRLNMNVSRISWQILKGRLYSHGNEGHLITVENSIKTILLVQKWLAMFKSMACLTNELARVDFALLLCMISIEITRMVQIEAHIDH